ncbi:biotin synthase BioB [Buchnera aphidicola]|uniref:biotin synthase BioB n=1 Tax=Buchnera aphidicola TaxID=9 RepID=UPI00223784DD|nr:biotin synthase BioB [Buchnera aphidicola]MCW5197695.1 biotin synthase BioB [Buchnera aphidicola (Chaitophorus viminalis)]
MNLRWTFKKTQKLFKKPFFDLIYQAQKIHRKYFDPNRIQVSTLLSIKTGLCPEDCKYCPQSARHPTNLKYEPLLNKNKILKAAKKAKKIGASRFCMGAAWKNPKEKDIPYLEKIVKKVKKLGLETCMTLGELTLTQAQKLHNAGLDFYNHNIDTSKNFYSKIISTRTYKSRLKTLKNIRNSGIKICSGGIIGLGEKVQDRIEFLMELSNLPKPPESIPINMLVKIPGTPLENNKKVNEFDFIRIIAIARIMMPKSYIRLSAGREKMNFQTQAMCFMVGANSIFYGCKLLTTKNQSEKKDIKLFQKLDLKPEKFESKFNNQHYNKNFFYNALEKE